MHDIFCDIPGNTFTRLFPVSALASSMFASGRARVDYEYVGLLADRKDASRKGETMLKVFKPITDLTGQISGILQGARGFMEKAGGQGLRGVVREAFDFNADGFMEEADRRTGRLVLHLTIAGDQDGVETILRFRNYAMKTIEELQRLNQITSNFESEDPEELGQLVNRIESFLESRETDSAGSDREEALRQEIARLKLMTRHLDSFLDDQERLLGGEDVPRGRYPVALTHEVPPAGTSKSGKKYPVAGLPAKKKPTLVVEEKPDLR
jgi:hypothetical protein